MGSSTPRVRTPRTQASKVELLKQLVTSFGYNPEEVLRNDPTGPHRIIVGSETLEDSDVAKLAKVLRRAILEQPDESTNSFNQPRYFPSVSYGSPGGDSKHLLRDTPFVRWWYRFRTMPHYLLSCHSKDTDPRDIDKQYQTRIKD